MSWYEAWVLVFALGAEPSDLVSVFLPAIALGLLGCCGLGMDARSKFVDNSGWMELEID